MVKWEKTHKGKQPAKRLSQSIEDGSFIVCGVKCAVGIATTFERVVGSKLASRTF